MKKKNKDNVSERVIFCSRAHGFIGYGTTGYALPAFKGNKYSFVTDYGIEYIVDRKDLFTADDSYVNGL